MTIRTLGRAAAVLATAPVYGLTWLLGRLWRALRITAAVCREGFERGNGG